MEGTKDENWPCFLVRAESRARTPRCLLSSAETLGGSPYSSPLYVYKVDIILSQAIPKRIKKKNNQHILFQEINLFLKMPFHIGPLSPQSAASTLPQGELRLASKEQEYSEKNEPILSSEFPNRLKKTCMRNNSFESQNAFF